MYLGIMRDFRRRALFTFVNEKGEEGGVYPRFWNQDEEDPRGEMFRAKRGGTPISDCESEFEADLKYVMTCV